MVVCQCYFNLCVIAISRIARWVSLLRGAGVWYFYTTNYPPRHHTLERAPSQEGNFSIALPVLFNH
ncbi:MAG: hypothetical protein JWR54_1070 [Mucilaginibacter sp.]|nr:hypothetical protein [Mucilaginibacter sp.]